MLKIIEHHSASAGNTFIDCPQMWIIDKLYGFETEENATCIIYLSYCVGYYALHTSMGVRALLLVIIAASI